MHTSTVFISRKSWFLWFVWGALIGLGAIYILFGERPSSWGLLPLSVPVIMLAGVLFQTDYRIEADTLYYRSGFFRGKVSISSIRKIERNHTLWAGYKAAAATRGLVIHYNRFDDLYVTPEAEAEFLQALREINPRIEMNG